LAPLKDHPLPTFVTYNRSRNQLEFLPSNLETQGRTFYFVLAVGDDSGCQKPYPYFFTLRMNGEIVPWTTFDFEITKLTTQQGVLSFTNAIDAIWLS
jgi:hypothetical protein